MVKHQEKLPDSRKSTVSKSYIHFLIDLFFCHFKICSSFLFYHQKCSYQTQKLGWQSDFSFRWFFFSTLCFHMCQHQNNLLSKAHCLFLLSFPCHPLANLFLLFTVLKLPELYTFLQKASLPCTLSQPRSGPSPLQCRFARNLASFTRYSLYATLSATEMTN